MEEILGDKHFQRLRYEQDDKRSGRAQDTEAFQGPENGLWTGRQGPRLLSGAAAGSAPLRPRTPPQHKVRLGPRTPEAPPAGCALGPPAQLSALMSNKGPVFSFFTGSTDNISGLAPQPGRSISFPLW